MGVNNVHPDYAKMLPVIQAVRDAVEGDPAIKRKKDLYLPADFAKTAAGIYSDHYIGYLTRAFFLGVTGRTKESMVGMVFRKAPEVALPLSIEALLEDIDGGGQSLEQIAKNMVGECLETGKFFLLVDYPTANDGMDAETEQRLGLRPTIAPYPFESLINWQFEGIGGRQQLTLAVLREIVDSGKNEFAHETEYRYRVLRLRDGVYTQQIYDNTGQPITPAYSPRMAGGKTFDRIPLHIAGAKSNLPGIDMPPLYDIARINISHYQTAANVMESGYIGTQPILHVDVGDTELAEWSLYNPGPLSFGNRHGITTKNGGVTVHQAASTDYNLTVMAHLEKQMIFLGAQLVQRGGSAETAEAARINASAEASVLAVIVGNISEAIEAALEDVALFIGENTKDIMYSLNNSFWESSISSQDLQTVLQAKSMGVISQDDVLYMMRQGRVFLNPDKTNEQILEDAASELLNDFNDE